MKMDFYSIIISILRRLSSLKWVLLGRTVEGGSKNANFFTVVRWRDYPQGQVLTHVPNNLSHMHN